MKKIGLKMPKMKKKPTKPKMTPRKLYGIG